MPKRTIASIVALAAWAITCQAQAQDAAGDTSEPAAAPTDQGAPADAQANPALTEEASPVADGAAVDQASGATPAESSAPLDTIPVDVAEPTQPEPAEEKKSQSRMVEEIVVTAQKREENAQDVPVSIAAFSAEKLDAAGIESTKDLMTVTPGLTITGSAGFNLIYLRGIGTSAFIPSFDPSVATYVDGLYVPSQQATLTDLGGVERVEVLKGPQGTLFGRNSTGGAISVITKAPGDEFDLSAEIERSNFDGRKAKVYTNIPLTEALAMSVSAIYSRQGAYYDVVADPNSAFAPPDYELRPELTRGGRIKLRWRPTDNLDFTLAGYRILQSGSLAFVEPNARPNPTLGAPITPAGDYKTNANTEPTSNSETTAIYGSALWNLPWVDVKLIVGDQDQTSFDNVYDFDGGQPDLATFTGPEEPSRLKTAELQFLSNGEGLTPDWLKWITGFYYLEQKAGFDPFVAYVGDTGILPELPPELAALLPGLAAGEGPVALGAFGVLRTHSYSGFLQGTAEITDWMSLTLGARYQKEDRFLIKQNSFASVAGSEPVTVIDGNEPKRKQHNVSPRVALEFRPLDDLLAYASFSRGFKSGSYNIVTLYTPFQYVDPERVTTFEVGAKTSFIQGLTFNVAVFNNEIDNLQETKLSLTSGGAISAENAGSARTHGAEFDAVWVPMSELNPGFVVTGGFTYIDAIYTDYQNASGFDETTGLAFGSGSVTEPEGRDFSGNRIARTPKYSGGMGLSQTIDTGVGPIELGGDWYYNGGFNFAPQNADATEQDAYSLFNARASLLLEKMGLRITGWGRNLADKKYAATSLTVDFGTFQQLAIPRTYGVSLGYDF